MTITIGTWIIPALLSIAIWVFIRIKNPPRPRRDWDFGIDYLIFFLIGAIATLVVWLLYFATLYFLNHK